MQSESSHFGNLFTGDVLAPYFPEMHSVCSSSEWIDDGSGSVGGEILVANEDDDQKYTTKTTAAAEAKALAASLNHKEAEKRRRQRINSHLDTLRTLLPSNSKTDKASLLGRVVEELRELKKQSSECLPSEEDDIMVVVSRDDESLIIKACFCCEDRSDLIPELIETLKTLQLSPLKAEMVSFGGRIRNVLVVSGDKCQKKNEEVVEFLRQALRSLVHGSTSTHHFRDSSKRQRTLYNY